MTTDETTTLGARLYAALERHGLLNTYIEHGGEVDLVKSSCVLGPRSLGALVRLLPGMSVYQSAATLKWSVILINPRAMSFGESNTPEQAVARALLLALGEDGVSDGHKGV